MIYHFWAIIKWDNEHISEIEWEKLLSNIFKVMYFAIGELWLVIEWVMKYEKIFRVLLHKNDVNICWNIFIDCFRITKADGYMCYENLLLFFVPKIVLFSVAN